MSFQNSMQDLQRFIINQRYSTPRYESIDAVVEAARLNTTIIAEDIPSNGKNRAVKISYYPIRCNSAADDCNQTFCDAGPVQEPVQEFFKISRCTASEKQTLHVSDLRSVDGDWGFSAHAMAQFNSGIGSWRKALAQEIDALLLANAGLQLDGNPTKRVTMTNNTTGVIQPVGLWEIEQDFSDGGFINPFTIGSKEIFQWKKALGIATDNTTTGQALAKLGETNMFYDTLLNSVAGDTVNGEHIIAFDPQAMKFVSYNKHLGIFATDLKSIDDLDRLYKGGPTDYIKGAIHDFVTGLTLDLYVNYDKCLFDDEGGFTWYYKLNWDIFFPQVQACNLPGVNGIFHYRTCPIKLAPCPTGDNPPAPANQNIYENVPGAIYPLYVGDLFVNGRTTKPNVTIANIDDLIAMLNGNSNMTFYKSGTTKIHYSGFYDIIVNINNGDHELAFEIPSPPVSN